MNKSDGRRLRCFAQLIVTALICLAFRDALAEQCVLDQTRISVDAGIMPSPQVTGTNLRNRFSANTAKFSVTCPKGQRVLLSIRASADQPSPGVGASVLTHGGEVLSRADATLVSFAGLPIGVPFGKMQNNGFLFIGSGAPQIFEVKLEFPEAKDSLSKKFSSGVYSAKFDIHMEMAPPR